MKTFPLSRLVFVLGLLFASFAFIGCGDDDPTPDPPEEEPMELDKNVSLQFSTTFDGEPLLFNDELAVGEYRFQLTTVKFYLSNLAFVKTDGTEVNFPDPILFDLGSTLDLKDTFDMLVEPGDYESIRFGVGLDADTNATNAEPLETSNPLSSSQNMWWGWAKAYIFIKLEGRYDNQEIGTDLWDQAFVYHMGNDEIYQETTIGFAENIKSNELSTIELNIDLKKVFFSENNPIDLLNDPTSHVATSPLVIQLADNFIGAFE